MALEALHGSPTESSSDLTMPFPVPASRKSKCHISKYSIHVSKMPNVQEERGKEEEEEEEV